MKILNVIMNKNYETDMKYYSEITTDCGVFQTKACDTQDEALDEGEFLERCLKTCQVHLSPISDFYLRMKDGRKLPAHQAIISRECGNILHTFKDGYEPKLDLVVE